MTAELPGFAAAGDALLAGEDVVLPAPRLGRLAGEQCVGGCGEARELGGSHDAAARRASFSYGLPS